MSKHPCLCLAMRNPIALVNNHYSAQQTAQMLGLKFTQILMFIKKNKLAATIMGRKVMVSKQEILRFAEENKIHIR